MLAVSALCLACSEKKIVINHELAAQVLESELSYYGEVDWVNCPAATDYREGATIRCSAQFTRGDLVDVVGVILAGGASQWKPVERILPITHAVPRIRGELLGGSAEATIDCGGVRKAGADGTWTCKTGDGKGNLRDVVISVGDDGQMALKFK
jgi:hypothetical protein